MFKKLKDWWNKDEIKLQQQINSIETKIAELLAERDDLVSQNKKLADELKQTQHDDSLPWVQINSDGFDENRGIKIAMDWNEEFIKYIEDLQIKGPTEEAAVQRWLAMVNLHLIEQLENEAIENDPRGTVKDVVDGY